MPHESKEKGYECKIANKSLVEVQTTTHQEILGLGDDLFQKVTQKQQTDFEIVLNKQRCDLTKILQQEKIDELEDLKSKHEESIANMEEYFMKLQNDALIEEAERVKTNMNKVTEHLIEETALEGQKHLRKALSEARKHFEVEKAQHIEKLTREQEKIRETLLNQERDKHENVIRKLNEEWGSKLKLQEEASVVLLNRATQEIQREMEEKFEAKLKETMKRIESAHQSEIEVFVDEMKDRKADNDGLYVEIEQLKSTLAELKASMLKVMDAFRIFIESTDGFSSNGQAEFILHELVSAKLQDFLTS